MSKYVIDASVVLHLLRANLEAPTAHVLLALTLIRSKVFEALYQAVRDGETSRTDALEQLARFAGDEDSLPRRQGPASASVEGGRTAQR